MEIWSEIRNIHLKSMLPERCSEPNALLEAVIKQAHRRGQLTPQCRHFQAPDRLRNTPGNNCTPKSSWQWRSHQGGPDLYQYLSGPQDGEEEQMICPNLPWVGSSDCHNQGWAQEASQLLPMQFYDKGRDCSSGGRNHLCFRNKALHYVQIPEVQPSKYCASTPPALTHTIIRPLELQNDIAETSQEAVHILSCRLGAVRPSFPSFWSQVT